MKGRYASPFRPRAGRRTWSRTARRPSSPRLCVLPGISLGLRNATQKNTITASAERIASSSGLVKLKEPILNRGLKSKFDRLGAGYPHPLKMWQPPAAAAATTLVTDHLPSGGSPALAVGRTDR